MREKTSTVFKFNKTSTEKFYILYFFFVEIDYFYKKNRCFCRSFFFIHFVFQFVFCRRKSTWKNFAKKFMHMFRTTNLAPYLNSSCQLAKSTACSTFFWFVISMCNKKKVQLLWEVFVNLFKLKPPRKRLFLEISIWKNLGMIPEI